MQEEPAFQAALPTSPEEVAIPQTESAGDQSVHWTASEYIAHHKSMKWYLALAVSAIVISAIIWLLTRDKISAIVVLVVAAVLGGYGARQPRELEYSLDTQSLTIGPKQYDLESFRSFTVDDQQAFASVNLMPLKRFAPGLSIYCSPDDEAAIIGILSLSLPIEEHRPDPIDRLMHRIRF